MFCVNRNGWFHFRLRVPHDLTEIVGTTHIQCPLKTKQKRVANKLSLELRDRFIPQFQRLRMELLSGIDHSQLQQLASELLPVVGGRKKAKQSQSAKTVSVLVASYLDDRSKHLDERTLMVAKYVFDLLIWVVGDASIGDISRSDCREFRDTLLRLPPRALSHSSRKSASEVIAMDLKSMHPKTVNKNIQFVSAMFNWAVSEELIADNPAKGLTVSIKRKASLERKAYDADTLSLIFNNLSRSDAKPENYWLPLLGYFTGMRVEELCQLRIEDIVQIDGVDCIRVSPEAGSLKTINAERVVPIHSHIIDLGFMVYVKRLDESKTKRLWQNLKINIYGRYSSAYTKRFGRFKRGIGIKDSQLTFHSFRHTFANELKQIDVSEHLIAQLIGHSNSSITMSRYGKEYEVNKLSEAVERLNLQGVSI
jgi:integrase